MKKRSYFLHCIIFLILSVITTGCEILHPQEPISINPAGIVCSHEGGEFVIGVKGEKGWTVSGMPDWVKVRSGSDLAVIDIESNEGFERNCILTFADAHSSATLEISQESCNILTVSTDTVTADYREETFSIDVECYRNWDMECSHDWLRADLYSGEGPATISISISENTGTEDRRGFISFKSGDLTSEVCVTQLKGPVLEVERDRIEVDGDGGVVQVLYMSDHDVEITSECDWIRLISKGSNIKMIAFEVLKNSAGPREGRVKVSLIEYPEIFREITVSQGERISHPSLSIEEGTYMEISSKGTMRLHPIFEDMTDTSLRWSSDSPETASVDDDGIIYIYRSGRCFITASNAYHRVKASIELNIRLKASSMKVLLNDQDMSINPVAVRYPGESLKASIVMDPPEAYSDDIILYADDTESIEIEGRTIRCLKPGKSTIHAESVYQKLQAQFTIIVLEP